MIDQRRYVAIVPAAGVGKRMAADKPKQYITLGDKTILEHTVSRLLQSQLFDQIVVAVSSDDQYWRQIAILKEASVTVVFGGEERSDSVLAALHSLSVAPLDWILVHDVARPCITKASIEKLMATLKDNAVGGLLAIPVSDTVKRVNDQQQVTNTVDRADLWRAQTPQMFPFQLLTTALEQATNQSQPITDEASALELMGLKPTIVEGLASNIKVTQPEDIALAYYYLYGIKN